jgi:hypothetical protein
MTSHSLSKLLAQVGTIARPPCHLNKATKALQRFPEARPEASGRDGFDGDDGDDEHGGRH